MSVSLSGSISRIARRLKSLGPVETGLNTLNTTSEVRLPRPSVPLASTQEEMARLLRKVADAAAATSRLAVDAVRYAVLPSGSSMVSIALREGLWELHWKTIGDALTRLARHSGPVATKLGQILATRNDILPETLCERLQALYTEQPPMTEKQLNALLWDAFPRGMPFKRFDLEPIAVGSIGQVHGGQLVSGEPVTIKLLRPGVLRAIDRDLNAIEFLLDLLGKIPGYRGMGTGQAASRALRDLGDSIRSEVDMRREADALEEFGSRFRTNPRVCIPKVYRRWCSEHALVMEALFGEPLSAVRSRAKSDPDTARKVANLAIKEILAQVFDEGHFHADPHAGNLLVLPDGRLGLIDLGLVGETIPEDRKRIARAVRAIISGNPDAATRSMLEFGALPPNFDYDAFRRDLTAVFRQNKGEVLARVTGQATEEQGNGKTNRLEHFVNQLFTVAYEHEIYVPKSTTLLIKTLVTIEGVARSLDPNINIVAAAIPIILQSLTPRWLRWKFW